MLGIALFEVLVWPHEVDPCICPFILGTELRRAHIKKNKYVNTRINI